MKTPKDPRHIERIKIMQDLFAWDFNKEEPLKSPRSKNILANLDQIDPIIAKAAPAWPLEKINKIDLAILRQSVYELIIAPKERREIPPTPTKVVVDEAVELAKQFGSDSSPAFVNGVLGKIIDDYGIPVSNH